MKQRLQKQLQSQVGAALPGYLVVCEFSTGHAIDIYLMKPRTRESMRITGVSMQELLGPGALEQVVDQLMFEILTVAANEQTSPSQKE